MTEQPIGPRPRTSRVIKGRPEELYAAFLDPAALVDWLPPAEMTGEIHEFDARVGGGYRMSHMKCVKTPPLASQGGLWRFAAAFDLDRPTMELPGVGWSVGRRAAGRWGGHGDIWLRGPAKHPTNS